MFGSPQTTDAMLKHRLYEGVPILAICHVPYVVIQTPNLQYIFYCCYYSLANFSVTDPTSSSNDLDASSLSAIRMLDIIRLAPVDLTAS